MGKYIGKYIKKHSLSVGFNPSIGQEFFDTLLMCSDYIKDYFFDVSREITGAVYGEDVVYNTLKSCDTYGLPANLLFNSYTSFIDHREKIEKLRRIINLRAVTILNPCDAVIVKNEYHDLEVHLSVRFWDWGRFPNPIARVPELAQYPIDVINVSGVHSFNDYAIMQKIHDYGIKTKLIVNEGCIVRKDMNYSQLPEFKDFLCRANPFSPAACFSVCTKVYELYPWMQLANVNIYKESLKYYDGLIDIWKISGRHRSLTTMVNALTYWTSDSDTVVMNIAKGSAIDVTKHYDTFLDYIATRSKCRGCCVNCQMCKKYWEIFTEGIDVKNIIRKVI